MAKSGESRPSFWGDHTNHYDSRGQKIGESRESVWGDHTNHYDSRGQKAGESRESVWGDHTNHYDSRGQKIGESRESVWGDHTNHYDSRGQKAGESRESVWGDHTNHYGAALGSHHARTQHDYDRSSPSLTSNGSSASIGDLIVGLITMIPGIVRFGSAARWKLVLVQMLGLLVGLGLSALGILLLAVVLDIFSSNQASANLMNALTTDRQFGILIPISWSLFCVWSIVLGLIFFVRHSTAWFYGAVVGSLVGSGLLVLLGSTGHLSGWGGAAPFLAAAAGNYVGNLIAAYRALFREPLVKI